MQDNSQHIFPPYEVGPIRLQTFYDQLNEADRLYLRDLGNPELLEDFRIVEDGRRLSDAVAVVYSNVLILCRRRALSSVKTFDGVAYGVKQQEHQDEALFVYAYFYPRHISAITKTVTSWHFFSPND